jgi:hypothetical protein
MDGMDTPQDTLSILETPRGKNKQRKREGRIEKKSTRRQDADTAMARKLAAAGRPRGEYEAWSDRNTTTKSVEFVCL